MKRIPYLLVLVLSACLLLTGISAAAQDTAASSATSQKIDKRNLVIKEWNTDVRTGAKTLDHVTTYSADGKKLEEIEYSSSGQKWRKRFFYNDAGKCIEEDIYDERNRLNSIKKFEYNDFGRKKTQTTYNAKGKVVAVKHFEYIVSNDE